MPFGYFTIERWSGKGGNAAPCWVSVCHLEPRKTLRDALELLESQGGAGLFRVVQTQRVVWAEKRGAQLRLRKWHASSPESLARLAEAFDADGGIWPEAKARRELAAKIAKKRRRKKLH